MPQTPGAPPLRYTRSGHLFIAPGDDLDAVVDAMLETGYGEEFCVADSFDTLFLAELMAAGFLVMSEEFYQWKPGSGRAEPCDPPEFILLPKLHLVRSALFFPRLHIKKSIQPLLSRYELRVDADFDRILRRCVQTHGDGWLTTPLQRALKDIRRLYRPPVWPACFGVYRDGELRAGEFGVICGGTYTSYSGYHDENNAGTVQIILMARWLEQRGSTFLDLGMPLDYKDLLGAENISPGRFVELFREARNRPLVITPPA